MTITSEQWSDWERRMEERREREEREAHALRERMKRDAQLKRERRFVDRPPRP